MEPAKRGAWSHRPWMPVALWIAMMSLVAPCVSGAGVASSAGPGVDAERMRRELATHVLRTLDGRTQTLGALRGEVVVVNFWASWCGPCRRELPRLDALSASIAGQGGRVVAVSIDQEARNVRRFVTSLKLSLPVYHDGPDGLARTLDLPHVPFTVVLDRSGAVAFTTSGADDRALDAIASAARRSLAAAPGESPTIAGGTP